LYESRSYVEALPFMERALAEPVLPLTAAMRREVENLRDQARLFVSRLYVTSEPVDAEVKVDQRAAAREGDGAVLLDPGDHELALSAVGYEPESRTLRARSGEALRVHYKLKSLRQEPLVSVSVAPATSQPTATAPTQTSSTRSSPLPWIVIGTSGALLAAGGVMLGLAVADKAAVEHPDSTHWSDVSSAYERGSTLFPLGYVLAGVGLAGLATGIVLKLWPADQAAHDAAAKFELTPGRVSFRLSL
jgi:hypothetical protein